MEKKCENSSNKCRVCKAKFENIGGILITDFPIPRVNSFLKICSECQKLTEQEITVKILNRAIERLNFCKKTMAKTGDDFDKLKEKSPITINL
jgi:hypothetical protein